MAWSLKPTQKWEGPGGQEGLSRGGAVAVTTSPRSRLSQVDPGRLAPTLGRTGQHGVSGCLPQGGQT